MIRTREAIAMTIVGIRPSSFKGNQGNTISGKNIYLTYPLEKGEGHRITAARGSFVGLLVQRGRIHIDHGILGASTASSKYKFPNWIPNQ